MLHSQTRIQTVQALPHNFSALFSAADIVCGLADAGREAAVMEILKKLAFEHGVGNVSNVFAGVMERESDMSTIIAPGIAVPHARVDSVENLVVGLGTSAAGITWTGGEKVNLIILLLVPKSQPGMYLQALAALAKSCGAEPEFARRTAELKKPEDVWRFFDRDGMTLPDYICAGDIMSPVTVSLAENDTLERAVDLFIKHSSMALPVVDVNGALVGVVSAQELLRVVLPDYILWMDDLSPIINFEPFMELLRRESTIWLAEIMTTDFATVQIDAPAIQVAKEMTRSRTDYAFVMEGKTLKGVVSLRRFLNKVMRE